MYSKVITKKVRNLILVLSVFVLFFLIVVGVIFVLISEGEVKEQEEYDFRFYEFNPNKNESSFGFMKMKRQVEKNDFLSYYDSFGGSYYVVSPFGSTTADFRCSGTCYCDEMRRSTSSISQPLIYLVAAVTSLVAISFARDHFHEECVNILSQDDTCVMESIESEVEGCVLATDEIISEDDSNTEVVDLLDGKKVEINRKGDFFCKGTCSPCPFGEYFGRLYELNIMDSPTIQVINQNSHFLRDLSENRRCNELEYETVVSYPEDYTVPKDSEEYIDQVVKVTTHFVITHLHSFCMDASRKRVRLYNRIGQDLELNIHLCDSMDDNRKTHSAQCIPQGSKG